MAASDFGLTFILVGAAALFLPHLDPHDNRARMTLFEISVLLTWRYIGWRFSATIPPLAANLESLYAWLFAVVEAVAAIGSTVAFITLGRTLDRSREATEMRHG